MSQQGLKIQCGSQKQLLVARGIYVVGIGGIFVALGIFLNLFLSLSLYIQIYIHVGPIGKATKTHFWSYVTSSDSYGSICLA